MSMILQIPNDKTNLHANYTNQELKTCNEWSLFLQLY